LDVGNGHNGLTLAGDDILASELDGLAADSSEPSDSGFCSVASPRDVESSVDSYSEKLEELQIMGVFVFIELFQAGSC
jgi:hypothetical protein